MKRRQTITVQDVTAQDSATLRQQAVFQSKLFSRLKKWLPRAMCCTAVFLVLILYGKSLSLAVTVIGWIGLILSLGALLLIGLALHHGKQNLERIFDLLDGGSTAAVSTSTE